MKILTLLPILLLVGACAETASFQPTENITAAGHGGQLAAGYDIGKSAGGSPYVHVNVWSDGASVANGRTQVGIALEVRNTGSLPVQLDQRALSLEAFNSDGRHFPAPALTRIDSPTGSLAVPPGSAVTLHLAYTFPVKIPPDALSSLRLRWSILRQDGQRYVQFTEFGRTPDYEYGYPYYSPFWYDPFFFSPFYYYPAAAVRVPVVVEREHVQHHPNHH